VLVGVDDEPESYIKLLKEKRVGIWVEIADMAR
jgi:hypothetical protein